MTAIDYALYAVLLDIEEEKARNNVRPIYSLLVRDRVHERMEEKVGHPVTQDEYYDALEHLMDEHKVYVGETIRDHYAKIIYRDIPSSL